MKTMNNYYLKEGEFYSNEDCTIPIDVKRNGENYFISGYPVGRNESTFFNEEKEAMQHFEVWGMLPEEIKETETSSWWKICLLCFGIFVGGILFTYVFLPFGDSGAVEILTGKVAHLEVGLKSKDALILEQEGKITDLQSELAKVNPDCSWKVIQEKDYSEFLKRESSEKVLFAIQITDTELSKVMWVNGVELTDKKDYWALTWERANNWMVNYNSETFTRSYEGLVPGIYYIELPN